jgi:hypothetical protein
MHFLSIGIVKNIKDMGTPDLISAPVMAREVCINMYIYIHI